MVGSYWEKGNRNEIDFVALNDLKREMVLVDVKLSKSKTDIRALKQKARVLLTGYSGYRVEWLALGLQDAKAYLR